MFLYYYDLMSQPSRALYIIFKLSNTEFKDCRVALGRGEHLTDEYKQNVNRFQNVPCIVTSDNFQLSESIAILRYLDSIGKINKNLYPSCSKERAKIDEYLEWQHNNTRMACAMYFRKTVLEPQLLKIEPNLEFIEYFKIYMERTLDIIEETWLKDTKFMAGNELTVADIFAACEIEQTEVTGYDAFLNRPNLLKWFRLVKEKCSPHYGDAHKILYLFNKKYQKSKL